MEKFTLVLDSSQITTYLECPQLWYYQYVERLQYPPSDKDNESHKAMNMGTYGHQLLDIFYTKRSLGYNINQSLEAVNDFNIDTEFMCTCGHIKKEHSIVCAKCTECNMFSPDPFPLDTVDRQTVLRSITLYVMKYQNNDFQAFNKDSIEVGFSEPIYEDEKTLYVLEGRIDLLGVIQGLPTIVDHKFQSRKNDLYKKSIQFKNYSLVCPEVNMLMINYIRLTKKTDEDTFVRVPVTFSSMEKRAWKLNLINIYKEIELRWKYLSIESDVMTRNWARCSGNKYSGTCMYTPLCEMLQPDLVQLKKEQIFVKGKEWKPW